MIAAASPSEATDDHLLDAYSRAVVDVVERAGAAVVSLEVGGKIPGTRWRARGGAGSGFVVTPDGYVMTNSHVVSGHSQIRVRTSGGETVDGRLAGDDPAPKRSSSPTLSLQKQTR